MKPYESVVDEAQDPKAKPIIIISGPPGAGKSSVARELVALSTEPTAYIEGDTFWSFFAKGFEDERQPGNFRTVMRAMTSAAVPYSLAGYHTILDFSLPPWYLDAVKKIAGSRGVPAHYIVIRPSKEVCAARAASRTEGAIADYENFQHLYASFDQAKPYIVGSDSDSVAETARLIQEGVAAGTFRLL